MKKLLILLFSLSALALSRPAPAAQRIISLKPSITEMIFALGEGPHLVGVTSYCKFPPEARKIEKIGGYANPSLEKIVSLKPDLVVLIPDATSPALYESLRRIHIPTLLLKGRTLEDVPEDLQRLGEALGVSEKAGDLVTRFRERWANLHRSPTSLKACVVVQRHPLIVAGPGTFISEILEQAGLKNGIGPSALPYPRLSREMLIAMAPDLIFDTDPEPEGSHFWETVPTLPAVRNHQIFPLSPDLLIPSPRILDTLEKIENLIHSK